MHHQFSVPFFEQQRLFNSTSENDLEAGDDNEVEALIKKVNLNYDFILKFVSIITLRILRSFYAVFTQCNIYIKLSKFTAH